MSLVFVGAGHRRVPLAVRERLFLAGDAVNVELEELQQAIHDEQPGLLTEHLVLATCNRFELYAVSADPPAAAGALIGTLSRRRQLPPDSLHDALTQLHGEPAVVHLMRVAAGLDSQILGEPQILGQVAAALRHAPAAGPLLQRLFGQALHAGKRVRAETEISRHSLSIGHAAALLAARQAGRLDDRHVLVVGSGKIASLAARTLQARGAGDLTVVSRTPAHAQALAQAVAGRARPWAELGRALAEADVVVSATAAPAPVIEARHVPVRPVDRRLVLVDVALPRDVAADLRVRPDLAYYDLDRLQDVLDENLGRRRAAVPAAELIIAREAAAFMAWLSVRDVVPALVDMRGAVRAMADAELQRALRRLGDLDAGEREVVERLVDRIVGKVLHGPTVNLRRQAAAGRGPEHARAVRNLFNGRTDDPAKNAAAARTTTDRAAP